MKRGESYTISAMRKNIRNIAQIILVKFIYGNIYVEIIIRLLIQLLFWLEEKQG
jgi:hypothetical protein